jgi:hypothetical protein
MFTLKRGLDFGEVARRGLGAVHGELLEKALAYNLCHLARVRQEAGRRRPKRRRANLPHAA